MKALMKHGVHFVLMFATAVFGFGAASAAPVFPIETNPAVIVYGDGLAFDGTNYLVAALTGTNSSGVTNVNVQLVAPNGALIGSPMTVGGGVNLGSSGGLGVAFAGSNYLVAWSDSTIGSGVDMFGQLVSRTGAEVGAPFHLLALRGTNGPEMIKVVASDGTNFLAVWQDENNDYLYGQLVTPAGNLSGPAFLISNQLTDTANVAATRGKTNYLVIAQSNTGGVGEANQVFGAFVSSSGSAGGSFQISQTASTDRSVLTVAFDGTNFLAVWPWDPGPETEGSVTNWQFYARLVSQTGALQSGELALVPSPNPVIPSLAFDGSNYLLAYGFDSNTTNSDRNLRCQFLNRSASPVGPLFTPFAPQGTNVPLFALNGLLFDGTRFVMAASLGTFGVNGEIFATAIPASTNPPTLAPNGPLVGTQFPLLLTGTPGINYALLENTNVSSAGWTALVTNSPTNGTFGFIDTHATNKTRYYRALKQ
jgi:hypothetical protein